MEFVALRDSKAMRAAEKIALIYSSQIQAFEMIRKELSEGTSDDVEKTFYVHFDLWKAFFYCRT